MSNVQNVIGPLCGTRVGYGNWGQLGIGGQCGELASYWLTKMTNGKYQFGTGLKAEAWVPGSDCKTAWNVYTQTDWNSMGFEKIDNPKFSQLKDGDIFFINPRPNLLTGHVGIVADVSNNNVTTYEQNFGGAMYVQVLGGQNSWSYFGGFSGIVRPKKATATPNKEEIDMYLIQSVDKTGPHKGKWFISNGTHCRYIRTPRMLANYQNEWAKLNLRTDKMYSTEIFNEFGGEKNIL